MKPLVRSPFAGAAWAVGGPLSLWAAHFALCYVGVAMGCVGIARGAGWNLTELRWLLMVGSVLALGVGFWWVVKGCAGWRAAERREGRALTPALSRERERQREVAALPAVRATAALLAWVGMLWTAVPLVLLPPCG